jgi:hypothetical protein
MNHDKSRPPFRAEHVGSFPRPDRLLKARQDYSVGKIPKEDLKCTEGDCIREIVLLQERVGIGAITDGEYPKAGGISCLKNVMASLRNRPCRISSSGFTTGRNGTIRVSHA